SDPANFLGRLAMLPINPVARSYCFRTMCPPDLTSRVTDNFWERAMNDYFFSDCARQIAFFACCLLMPFAMRASRVGTSEEGEGVCFAAGAGSGMGTGACVTGATACGGKTIGVGSGRICTLCAP